MIAIGSDHAGYELKNKIIEHLNKKGYEVKDFGTDSSEKSVDYPDFGLMVAESVKNGECEKELLFAVQESGFQYLQIRFQVFVPHCVLILIWQE